MIPTSATHRGTPGLPAGGEADARTDQRVEQMAREFESLFMLQMLRQMRQAMALDEQPDPTTAPLMETIDEELSRALSRQGGIGLAETLMRAMAPAATSYTGPRARLSAPRVDAAGSRAERPRGAAASRPGLARPASPSLSAASSAPVPMATAVRTSPFGWRRDPFTDRARFHRGIDLRAAYGSEVATVAPGRVVWAGDQQGYGTTVVVEHETGLRSRYAHLSALAVRAGDEVEAGQALGRAGSSGRATGPHLHFEVTWQGRPVDPERVLAGLAAGLKDLRGVADSSYRAGSGLAAGAGDED